MLFQEEALRIKSALGNNCIDVFHIGSTSVPGLSAKPIIDMLPVVRNILEVDTQPLETLGYKSRGEMAMPFRRYFSNGSYHVHIWEQGADEIQKHLVFRDYLREHPEVRMDYQILKENLAEQFREDRPSYTLKKDPFVKNTLRKAGFTGFEFIEPVLKEDCHHYHRIRKEILFDHYPHVIYDYNHSTLTSPQHFHFVLKQLEKVIGVAHVELLDRERVALRPFAIDTSYQNQGYGSYLLKLVEKWIRHQGRKRVHLHARFSAVGFYEKAGYIPHLFVENDQYALTRNCIDMMKNVSL